MPPRPATPRSSVPSSGSDSAKSHSMDTWSTSASLRTTCGSLGRTPLFSQRLTVLRSTPTARARSPCVNRPPPGVRIRWRAWRTRSPNAITFPPVAGPPRPLRGRSGTCPLVSVQPACLTRLYGVRRENGHRYIATQGKNVEVTGDGDQRRRGSVRLVLGPAPMPVRFVGVVVLVVEVDQIVVEVVVIEVVVLVEILVVLIEVVVLILVIQVVIVVELVAVEVVVLLVEVVVIEVVVLVEILVVLIEVVVLILVIQVVIVVELVAVEV